MDGWKQRQTEPTTTATASTSAATAIKKIRMNRRNLMRGINEAWAAGTSQQPAEARIGSRANGQAAMKEIAVIGNRPVNIYDAA